MEGPEKIDEYVELAANKFVRAGGYSELDLKRMREIFRKYLITDYNRDIIALSKILQEEQAGPAPINRDWYKNEVEKIRTKFLMKVEEITLMG